MNWPVFLLVIGVLALCGWLVALAWFVNAYDGRDKVVFGVSTLLLALIAAFAFAGAAA